MNADTSTTTHEGLRVVEYGRGRYVVEVKINEQGGDRSITVLCAPGIARLADSLAWKIGESVDLEDPATALRYRHATETEPGDERGLAKMLAQAAEDVRETNPALAVLFGFMAECPPEVACGLRQELRGLAPRLHPDTGERAVVARLLPTLDAWAAVLL